MRRVILLLILAQISLIHYGQIIADHTVVDKYDKIPQQYINEIKKMLFITAGESHAWAYLFGIQLLADLDPTYAVSWASAGAPHNYTDQALRSAKAFWGDYDNETGWLSDHGEEDWYTNATAITRIKAGITYCNTNNLILTALGFGWCYDAVTGSGTAGTDPVYGFHWYGNSVDGPDGDKPWGIDADDYAVTANSVSMDTYLSATQEYIDYCASNGYITKVFFTTGPVDSYSAEARYQAYIKYEHIRDYVKADPTRILFDYADILCWDNDGTPTTDIWNTHIFPAITTTNLTPVTNGHISDAGALRLGKAIWWMLARIAGWDGTTTTGINSLKKNTSPSALVEKTKDEIRIKLDESYLSATVSLYDLYGRLVSAKKADSNLCVFNISHLPSGMYLVVLSKSKIFETHKIIIQ
jgi:hypothetical protein